MSSHCLIILMSLILPLPCITTQASSCINEEVSLMKLERKNYVKSKVMQPQMDATSHQSTESGVITTGLRPWKGQSGLHHRHHLRNMHGILNIIGWGTLLPIGMIVARYFRKFPLKCEEDWYPLHILCQTLGYIVGTIGWGIGIWLENSSKHYTLKTHRILGIIIFTLATLQMFSLCLQSRREDECRKCWQIYHHLLGYALIAMSIANIFEGISSLSHGDIWKWIYVGMLGILALIALGLELYRWIFKSRIQQQMALESDIYNSSQT